MKSISRKDAIRQGLCLVSAAMVGSQLRSYGSAPMKTTGRADWMVGKWGMMVHWIAPGPGSEKGKKIEDLNRAVDQFDVPGFIKQFKESGADYLIFTIGQNTTYYASPNEVLDKYAGPGHGSKRDLVLELATALHKINKRFIAYLPAEIKADPALHEGFRWNPDDQHEFEKRYTDFIRAYSLKFGKYVDGWWFDGCYPSHDFYVPRNWQLWCDVSRAGNDRAVVAFNNGSFCIGDTQPLTPAQDFLSGECNWIQNGRIGLGNKVDPDKTVMPINRFVEGTNCQYHVLTPIDLNGEWGNNNDGPMPPPRYADAELFSFVGNCLKAGAAVTLNVGIYQEGHISPETMMQLHRLSGHLSSK